MKIRYDLFYFLGALLSSPVLAFGLLRTGKWRTDWPGRFGRTPTLPQDSRPTILLHGVSVGEINATRELVEYLTGPDSPPLRVVVSATTNTGFARARELYGDRLPVVRFPFDFSWMVSRFLDAVDPDVVALMELELWPNLAQICRGRGIPLSVLNGRLSDGSYRHYRWVRPLVRSMFRSLDAVGAQTAEYAERFRALGVPGGRITVTDTMKWDPVRLVDQVEGAEELAAAMGIDSSKPLVVAGSTGPGEESLLLDRKPDGVQLMLVPRKPERFQEVAGMAPGIIRRSERPDGWRGAEGDPSRGGPAGSEANELFLLDTMGELTRAFSLADVAVVGRSFVPMGGSDPIEPIALGKATVMGPHYDNFRGVVDAFREADGIQVAKEPWPAVRRLLDAPESRLSMGERGREVIRRKKGATARNAGVLFGLLRKGAEERGAFPASEKGRIRRWVFTAFVLYMLAGYGTTLVDRVPLSGTENRAALPSAILPARGPGEAVWSGVFSVHTNRSHDARGTREEVARAAASAGLDFVVIGDHPPDSRRPGWKIWHPVILDGVLIEGGQELRSPEAGKILAVGVDTTYKRWQGDYAGFTEMLDREAATAFVVHGRGPRGSERWVNPDARGVQGWEVLDISEFARHRLKGPWSLYHLITLLAGTPLGLGDEAMLHMMREGFETPTVAAYDSLRLREPLTATAGLNTHPKLKVGPFLLPSYRGSFQTLVTHVTVAREVAGESAAPPDGGPPRMIADQASRALMAGARGGDVFISLGNDPAARQFRAGVQDPSGSVLAGMGGVTPYAPGRVLQAGVEGGAGRRLLYRIVRNGQEVGWLPGPDLTWAIDAPGVYRVEVYTYWGRIGGMIVHLRPWIFANPVDIR